MNTIRVNTNSDNKRIGNVAKRNKEQIINVREGNTDEIL